MEIAVDTETTGRDFFHGCKPFMVTACTGKENHVWTGEVNPYNRGEVTWKEEDKQEIRDLTCSASSLLFHNAKFDVRALHSIGIDLTDQWDRIEDTMIASHVCCSGESHALKQLAFRYLGYYNEGQKDLKAAVLRARLDHKDYDLAREGHPTMPGEGGPGTRWYTMDYWLCLEECTKYGLDDVEMTWLLWQMYKDVLYKKKLYPVYEERKSLLEITYEMQSHGMNTYVDRVNQEISLQGTMRKILSQKILEECHIANSLDFTKEKDISFFLFNVLELPVTTRSEKTGKPLMNKDVIDGYIQSEPTLTPLQHFADFRRCGTKVGYLSSYLKWVDSRNKVHSDLLITGTRETRQASRNPNTQNIDKELSGIFGPPKGKVWLVYDLVNIELRIWGYEVGNKELTTIFDQKRSFHAEIAKTLYPKTFAYCEEIGTPFKVQFKASYYQWVKNGNFCIIYGGSEGKAIITYKALTDEFILNETWPERFPTEVPRVTVNAYRKIVGRFPEVPKFTASKIREVFNNEEKYGYPFITCKGGYRLDINPEQIYTTACNYFCQGSAGYIIGLAMQEVHRNPDYREAGAQMVNQVHDSLYIEVPIENNTPSLQESLKRSIEMGGERLLPTCEAELESIIYHPEETHD